VLILSANSGCRRQSCETGDARPGRWQAIEPSYHP
jgi:putative transposase